MKFTLGALTCFLIFLAPFSPTVVIGGGETLLDSPYWSSPKLMDLMEDAIFYVGYDDENMKPGLAVGKEGLLRTEPPGWQDSPEPGKVYGAYAPGLVGKALKLGSGVGTYAAPGNLKLSSCGAVSFWIKPIAWKENGGGGMIYFCTEYAPLGVQRMAGAIDKDGKCVAQEANMVWINPHASAVVGGLLENGKWHLLVFNWAWPTFSLSIDGGAPASQSLPRLLDNAIVSPKTFQLGSKGNPAATLMDEVMIFNRPLDAAEAKLMYDTVNSWAKKRDGAAAP